MANINENSAIRVALGSATSGGAVVPIDSANPLPMVAPVLATAGGLSTFRRVATADTNAVVVKAGPGRVYGYVIANPSATVKFVRLYNKLAAPAPAADAALIIRSIMIPAGGVVSYHAPAGLGGFAAGIGIAASGLIADNDVTALVAADLLIQIDYA